MTHSPPRLTKRELALFLHVSPRRSAALLHELPQLVPPDADYRTQLTALHHLDAASRNAPIPDTATAIRASGQAAPPLHDLRLLNLLTLREQFSVGDLPQFATLAAEASRRHDLSRTLLDPGTLAAMLLEVRHTPAPTLPGISDTLTPEQLTDRESGDTSTPDPEELTLPVAALTISPQVPSSFTLFVQQVQAHLPDLLDLLAASHPGDAAAPPEVVISRALFRQALLNVADLARHETRDMATLVRTASTLGQLLQCDDPLTGTPQRTDRQVLGAARMLDELVGPERQGGLTPEEAGRFSLLRAALIGSAAPAGFAHALNVGAVRVGILDLKRQVDARLTLEDHTSPFPANDFTTAPAWPTATGNAGQAAAPNAPREDLPGVGASEHMLAPVSFAAPLPTSAQPDHALHDPLSGVVEAACSDTPHAKGGQVTPTPDTSPLSDLTPHVPELTGPAGEETQTQATLDTSPLSDLAPHVPGLTGPAGEETQTQATREATSQEAAPLSSVAAPDSGREEWAVQAPGKVMDRHEPETTADTLMAVDAPAPGGTGPHAEPDGPLPEWPSLSPANDQDREAPASGPLLTGPPSPEQPDLNAGQVMTDLPPETQRLADAAPLSTVESLVTTHAGPEQASAASAAGHSPHPEEEEQVEVSDTSSAPTDLRSELTAAGEGEGRSVREVYPVTTMQGEEPQLGDEIHFPLATLPAASELTTQVQTTSAATEWSTADAPAEVPQQVGAPDDQPGTAVPLLPAAGVRVDVLPEVPVSQSSSLTQDAERTAEGQSVREEETGELPGAGAAVTSSLPMPEGTEVVGEKLMREAGAYPDAGPTDVTPAIGDAASLAFPPEPLAVTVALPAAPDPEAEARAVLAERLRLSARLLERVRTQERWTVQFSTAEHLADCLISAQELLAEHEALMEWEGRRLEPLMTPEDVQAFSRVDVRAWELVRSIRALQNQD